MLSASGDGTTWTHRPKRPETVVGLGRIRSASPRSSNKSQIAQQEPVSQQESGDHLRRNPSTPDARAVCRFATADEPAAGEENPEFGKPSLPVLRSQRRSEVSSVTHLERLERCSPGEPRNDSIPNRVKPHRRDLFPGGRDVG